MSVGSRASELDPRKEIFTEVGSRAGFQVAIVELKGRQAHPTFECFILDTNIPVDR